LRVWEKPVSLGRVRRIDLDGSRWASVDDLFTALLCRLDAPGWHGHNFDALRDSITSDINGVRPPYQIVVRRAETLPPMWRRRFRAVSDIFNDAERERGVDVSFRVG